MIMNCSQLRLELLSIASNEGSWAEAPNLKEISMKRARLAFWGCLRRARGVNVVINYKFGNW